MSMITASLWVPRGAAAIFPTKYDIDEDELARISKFSKLQLEDARGDLETARNENKQGDETGDSDSEEEGGVTMTRSKTDEDGDLTAYDLEHYDSHDDEEEEDGNGQSMPMFGNARALAYHESNADDPYITLQENEDEDEERDELQVLATDNMIVAAKVEDEVAHLEIYVYEDEVANLYVHHDIMLPAIPLCVEWLDLPVGKDVNKVDENSKGNYVAVGTFDPDIELWDLDTIDSMYPNAILGQGVENSKADTTKRLRPKKAKKVKKANDDFHVDAVLSLAANRQHRNLLASSSADKTVKLWDLNTVKCAKSYSHHSDKVCSIAWNPQEATVLLSGSYDKTVVTADMRAPEAQVPRWSVESDVEIVAWDPHNPNCFFVTTENGKIHYNDIRTTPSRPESSEAVWQLQAHDESLSAFDVNPIIQGFLATGSTDKEVKLWNIQPSGPSMVVSRNLDVGKVFSTKFAPDAEVGFRLAVAGSRGTMQIWDTSTNAAVRHAFATRMSGAPFTNKGERVVGIGEDSSDDEEEGGAEPGGDDPAMVNGWESMDEDDKS